MTYGISVNNHLKKKNKIMVYQARFSTPLNEGGLPVASIFFLCRIIYE